MTKTFIVYLVQMNTERPKHFTAIILATFRLFDFYRFCELKNVGNSSFYDADTSILQATTFKDRQTDKQTDKQTDRLTDKQTDRQTDTLDNLSFMHK